MRILKRAAQSPGMLPNSSVVPGQSRTTSVRRPPTCGIGTTTSSGHLHLSHRPSPIAAGLLEEKGIGKELHGEPVRESVFKWFSRCTGADPLSRPPKPESSGTKSRHNWGLCWLQWMAMTSSVPCHALRSPQSVAEPPFQPLDLPSDLFRSVHRSCLCMLG